MTPTLTQMNTWFNEYNALIFKGKLPKVKISFNNTRKQLGQFYWGEKRGIGIKISLYYDRPEREYRHTLIHEMCHLYCYNLGPQYAREGHGPMWQNIARYASQITGYNIQRIHHGASEWKVAAKNKAKEKAVRDKKNAPALLLDLDYGNYHFIVKTSIKVLQLNDSTNWECKVKTSAKSYKVLISTNPYFRSWQTSRSIHRGYRFGFVEYADRIAPLLKDAYEIVDIRDLFRGKYNKQLALA